jgi:hypothetical protein
VAARAGKWERHGNMSVTGISRGSVIPKEKGKRIEPRMDTKEVGSDMMMESWCESMVSLKITPMLNLRVLLLENLYF